MITKGNSWIQFNEQPPDIPEKKTKTWTITATREHTPPLGWIRWYGAWRKYCFFPEDGTIFDADCLQDIAQFCRDQTKAHMEGRRAQVTA